MDNLLVAVDFSQTTEPLINQATGLARALDSKLWVIHVASDESQAIVFESTSYSGFSPEFSTMPGDVQLARDLNAEELKREHAALLSISAKLRAEGLAAQALLLKGDPASQISEKANELDASMIILGSHGHGILHKAFLGSVSESVMKHARRSVLVVPARR